MTADPDPGAAAARTRPGRRTIPVYALLAAAFAALGGLVVML